MNVYFEVWFKYMCNFDYKNDLFRRGWEYIEIEGEYFLFMSCFWLLLWCNLYVVCFSISVFGLEMFLDVFFCRKMINC